MTQRQSSSKLASKPTYTPWRYFAPAKFARESGSALPATALSIILRTTGFEDRRSLHAELNKVQRHHISQDLQARLAKLFSASADPEACGRPLGVRASNGVYYELPFPFSVNEDLAPEIEIGAFSVTGRATRLNVGFRAQVLGPGMLKPRNRATTAMCNLIAADHLCMGLSELSGREVEVIATWLAANKVPKRLARDEEFLSDLETSVGDRIQQLVFLNGNHELFLGNVNDYVDVEGGEEFGISKD